MFAPWRLKYITNSHSGNGCFICNAVNGSDDRESLVVCRRKDVAVMLNRFPYNNGHVMVVPYCHAKSLTELQVDTLSRLMALIKDTERALGETYCPDGFNIGINMGTAAGAGLKDHIHVHVMPRWLGDTNFMTSVGGVRVIPEDLETTYEKLKIRFSEFGINPEK